MRCINTMLTLVRLDDPTGSTRLTIGFARTRKPVPIFIQRPAIPILHRRTACPYVLLSARCNTRPSSPVTIPSPTTTTAHESHRKVGQSCPQMKQCYRHASFAPMQERPHPYCQKKAALTRARARRVRGRRCASLEEPGDKRQAHENHPPTQTHALSA